MGRHRKIGRPKGSKNKKTRRDYLYSDRDKMYRKSRGKRIYMSWKR